jgi:filamentous hemagglutinin family protein
VLHPFSSRSRLLARRISRGVALAPFALSLCLAQSASAQVVTDGTLGAGGALGGPHYDIAAALGKQFGPNLFHSFSDFNIYAGESATFSGPSSVQNILSRVTGGQSSIIDGKLNSTITGANFFFINPAGVIFGPNAQINVSGNFTASTADTLKLGSNGVFNAQNPSASVLTSAPPSAFGFLGPNPQPIIIEGSTLVSKPGRSMSFVGGDISALGADITADNGKVQLVSVGSVGEAKLASNGSVVDTGSFQKLGNIGLEATNISTSGTGALSVHAENLDMTGESYLSAENDTASTGGTLKVQVHGDVTLSEGSTIQSVSLAEGKGGTVEIEANRLLVDSGAGVAAVALADGDGGDISIRAKTIVLDGRSDSDELTGIGAIAFPGATGNGGNISIEAETLISEHGAAITADNFGFGHGGNISIAAKTVEINGHGTLTPIGAESNEPDSGRGGNITIKADNLKLINGGGISSSTASLADSGNISIVANDILIQGGEAEFTGIEALTVAKEGGKAGDISITGQKLRIQGAAELAVDTFGSGAGGKISVHVKDVELQNQGRGAALLARSFGTGKGGDIEVVADRLHLIGDALINTNASGAGAGGDIRIRSGEVFFDGRTGLFIQSNGVYAESIGAGKGGNVEIDARNVTLLGGAAVSTSTGKSGDGGNIRLSADTVTLEGTDYTTGLLALTHEEGNSGNISVAARQLNVLGNALISTTTLGTGNSGTIDIAARKIVLDGRGLANKNGIASESRAQNGGNGGEITVDTGLLQILNGAGISTSTQGKGIGSDISIKAHKITLRARDSAGTDVFSSIGSQSTGTASDAGDSGNITIETDTLHLQDDSGISTTTTGTGEGGNILIKAKAVELTASGGQASISAQTQGKSGNGGTIAIESDSLRVAGNSSISTSSNGAGDGGTIVIRARDTLLDGTGSRDNSTISSESIARTAAGDSGKIEFHSDTFRMVNGAQISTTTGGNGTGGDVLIEARDVVVENGSLVAAVTLGDGRGGNIHVVTDSLSIRGNEHPAGFTADTRDDAKGDGGAVVIKAKNIVMSNAVISTGSLGQGTGGRITIETGDLSLDRSEIRAVSTEQNVTAGKIDIEAHNTLRLNASTIQTDALQSDGGNIALRVGNTLEATDSLISASAGRNGGNVQMQIGGGVRLRNTVLAALAFGTGGDISIRPLSGSGPRFVVLDNSVVLASASKGNGGNINIQSNVFLSSASSLIDASSEFGVAGNIAIESPNTNVGGSLVTLPSNPLDAESYLAERCVVQQTGQSSSFSVETRRAMPAQPGDLLPSAGTEQK